MRAFLFLAWLSVGTAALGQSLPSQGDEVYGARLFRLHCAQCHGSDKSGAGYLSKTLRNPPPKNLADPGFLARRTDEDLFSTITLGGRAVSAHFTMPNFGGQLEALDAWDLIAYLRKDVLTVGAFFPRAGRYLAHELEVTGALKERLEPYFRGEKLTVVVALSGSDASARGPQYSTVKGELSSAARGRRVLGYVTFAPLNLPGQSKPLFVGMSIDPSGTVERIRPQIEDERVREAVEKQLLMFEGQKGRMTASGEVVGLSVPLAAGPDGSLVAKELTRLFAQAVEARRYFDAQL